ncbi:hypothetical protein [Thalassobaculum sp.]|uniref:hypothetical protein n=1 Tax=Thalassobaculum sp. TaxID=2022740 RepID=UPI003B5B98F0
MKNRADEIVAETLSAVTEAGVEISALPPELRASIASHQTNLTNLAAALLAGGQSEEVVRSTLNQLFASYKQELARTIVALREQNGPN